MILPLFLLAFSLAAGAFAIWLQRRARRLFWLPPDRVSDCKPAAFLACKPWEDQRG